MELVGRNMSIQEREDVMNPDMIRECIEAGHKIVSNDGNLQQVFMNGIPSPGPTDQEVHEQILNMKIATHPSGMPLVWKEHPVDGDRCCRESLERNPIPFD